MYGCDLNNTVCCECLTGKEDKIDTVLATERAILLPSSNNKMECFSDKGELANV